MQMVQVSAASWRGSKDGKAGQIGGRIRQFWGIESWGLNAALKVKIAENAVDDFSS